MNLNEDGEIFITAEEESWLEDPSQLNAIAEMKPPQDVNPYINHCWNCLREIDSRVCKFDPPNFGYFCPRCGESLRGLKIKE